MIYADIAIVPSIGFEGIPYTIREAMRSGNQLSPLKQEVVMKQWRIM